PICGTILLDAGRSPVVLEAEMFREFQDWCLRTYGDSGKTKTVTRRKYNKIMQTLLQNEESDSMYVDNSHINAKFKFWVKSKGFQVGSNILGEHKKGASGKPVLYVPVKSTCADAGSAQDSLSLKRVAVVEDFFDIIYAMHVEMGADPGRAPKHAGQKKTYKAIAETYAFLPREAVTRFLMSCGECQKRMHINPNTAEFKENDRPTSLVPDLIDYNMPLTATYLKQMKLQCMTANERDESSVSSEDMDMAEPTWVSAERPPVPELSPPNGGMVHSPQAALKEEDGKPFRVFVCESVCVCVYCMFVCLLYVPCLFLCGCLQSPQHSSGSYDSLKTELSMSAEDLTSGRAQIIDDDDDDHDDHDDSDKITDAEGMDPERLKAFNMFVRLFVDENLDRMVPISKQPKEKIQAIIESCSRQFPEFQERSRKRIRTYLKSCRRMKKVGFETRPTPPHLTSAMAENILAAACESETRNAAKRMRLDVYQGPEEPATADKNGSRDPASVAPSGFSLAASAYSQSQDPVYTNGTNRGLNYSFRSYGAMSNNLPTTGATTTQTNGPTDLSMKSVAPTSSSSSSNSHSGQGGGGGGASAQLSPPEVTAVRQLIAGYRESAAFLLRSADELENLILQQN
uniref:Nucleolar protein 4-like a n=1 Tax=Salmo trutta TaxID=8032 RepID=A0A673Y229_SALTR